MDLVLAVWRPSGGGFGRGEARRTMGGFRGAGRQGAPDGVPSPALERRHGAAGALQELPIEHSEEERAAGTGVYHAEEVINLFAIAIQVSNY